jgi:phosphomannomutase / phosphoglucomutase
VNPAIFRAYDIRGDADRDLTDALAEGVGRAYGSLLRENGGRRIALGRDCRTHGPRLHAALVRGLLATGVEVEDVGVVPTPLLYFAVFHRDLDGGIQITGSHNPSGDNGFKMMMGKNSLHGDGVQEIRRRIESGVPDASGGEIVDRPIEDAYVDYVADNLSLGARPLRIVIDGGNGAGGPAALRVMERLGVEVDPIYTDMDGTFPNHHPDPTVAENLQDLIERVRSSGADVGVAYDGDADRIGVVDEAGTIIWGDRLMILLSREVLREVPGAAIVSEVKCSRTLFEDIAAQGGRPIMSQVGHSIIKERMKEEDALLGGEMSGHIFFRHRWFGFDDAVYATGRLLEILSQTDRSMSELLEDVPVTHVTPEIRLDCPDSVKFGVVERAVAHYKSLYDVIDIDGARVNFPTGWGLIRASNTQPVIVLRAEAESAEALATIRAELEGFVANHASS